MAAINTLIKNTLVVIEKTLHLTILAIVVFLCAKELIVMFLDGSVGVSSIMLIFIYLEIIQMIQIYFDSGKIPVRYPLYICMFNLARIISFEDLNSADALNHSIAILMVGLALLALAGRKYLRDTNINLPRISDLTNSGTTKSSLSPGS
jgi:protein PsiE|tara:strand:+ start:435 stop:881 length:447 start_codon:yes stop_codon:yes gene_type:complete